MTRPPSPSARAVPRTDLWSDPWRLCRAGGLALLLAAFATAALAQTAGGEDPTKANPTGPTLAVPPPQPAPDNGTNRGVIHPPQGVDPGIRQAPPTTAGAMPVIPPPGTPGGNQSVVPK